MNFHLDANLRRRLGIFAVAACGVVVSVVIIGIIVLLALERKRGEIQSDGIWIARYLPDNEARPSLEAIIRDIRQDQGIDINEADWYVCLESNHANPSVSPLFKRRLKVYGERMFIYSNKACSWQQDP
jgi:hypothetical protein